MEYLMKWQAWLEHSELYREFLINLPSPLNNVYFDLLLLFFGIFMIIRWIWDSIAIHRRYRRIRKRQKKIQQAQEYADMESMYREHEARKRQEQMEQQMKVMQMYLMLQYMPKQYQGTVTQDRIQEIVRNGIPTFTDFESKVVAEMPVIEGQKVFYLPQNESVQNEFERLMERLGEDETLKKQLQSQKYEKDAMAERNQRELDKKLNAETIVEESDEKTAQMNPEMQKELERRKAMAVKLALREQKRAERKWKWGGRK